MGATTLNVSQRIERLLHGGFHRLLHGVSHGEILAALPTGCNPLILLCPSAHCQSMSSLTVTVTALLTSRNTDVIVKRHQELGYPAPTCLPGQGGSRKRMRLPKRIGSNQAGAASALPTTEGRVVSDDLRRSHDPGVSRDRVPRSR